jgi:hypothetical protein
MTFVRRLNVALEFHHAEVMAVELRGVALHLRLLAMLHVSTGTPGTDDGIVVRQDVELILEQARTEGSKLEVTGKIADGHVALDGQKLAMLPLPFAMGGALCISLSLASGGLFIAHGATLRTLRHGEPQYLEHFHK